MLAVLFAAGCTPTIEQVAKLELASGQKSEWELDSDGDLVNVRFSSTQDWQVEMADDASWLEVSPLEGVAGNGSIKVKAESNTSGSTRTAEVVIRSSDLELRLTFTQENYVSKFNLLDTEGEIVALGGVVSIQLDANQDFTYTCTEEWVVPVTTNLRKAKEVIVAAEPNFDSASRTAEVVFKSKGAEYVFILTQEAAGADLLGWETKSFTHRSLAMRFTADWCGFCPYMATAFDSAKEQMNGSLELVSLHGDDSTYEFSGTNTLVRRFGVSGFPTGVVDARASIPNYQSTATTASTAMQVAKETQAYYPTTTSIACSSYLSGTDLTVFLPLFFKDADSYHVTVLLLEDGIVGYQNGGGSHYDHKDVARLAVTSISGNSIRISEDNTVSTNVYTAKVDPAWNTDNLKLLIYVEKSYGDQAVVEEVGYAEYGNYGDTYIDNCRVVKVGETAGLELK